MSDEIKQEDIDLNYARVMRKQVIETNLNDGKIPDDLEKQSMILTALKDLSRDAIANKKIKSEEKIAAGHAENTKLVADLLSQINTKRMRSETPVTGRSNIADVDLPPVTKIDGETSTQISNTTFVEFTASLDDTK